MTNTQNTKTVRVLDVKVGDRFLFAGEFITVDAILDFQDLTLVFETEDGLYYFGKATTVKIHN